MALKYLWKKGRRVGQPCALGHRQQTLLAQRTLAHTDPSLVRRVQRKWVDPQFRRYRPQYVLCHYHNPKFQVSLGRCIQTPVRGHEGSGVARVIGFDTVNDESKTERRYHKKFPYPKLWNYRQSPPYSYWFVILALKGRAFLLTCSKGLLHVCQYGKPQ